MKYLLAILILPFCKSHSDTDIVHMWGGGNREKGDTIPSWKQSTEYKYFSQHYEHDPEIKDTIRHRVMSYTFKDEERFDMRSHTDLCQPLRDSISKYQRNILTWKRRLSPLNAPGYNILLSDKIKSLEAAKKKFYQLLRKCK